MREHLGKIPHNMAPILVVLTQYVEEEWVNIVVQRFVIQEELRQQAQILSGSMNTQRV